MTTALVLAAGEGRRFGGAKQLAELRGRPLLAHAVATARAAGVDRVVVVLGARAEEVRAAVDLDGVEVAVCADWADGMSASLRCGLRAAAGSDEVVVLLGDQPGVGAGGGRARARAGRRRRPRDLRRRARASRRAALRAARARRGAEPATRASATCWAERWRSSAATSATRATSTPVTIWR